MHDINSKTEKYFDLDIQKFKFKY